MVQHMFAAALAIALVFVGVTAELIRHGAEQTVPGRSPWWPTGAPGGPSEPTLKMVVEGIGMRRNHEKNMRKHGKTSLCQPKIAIRDVRFGDVFSPESTSEME